MWTTSWVYNDWNAKEFRRMRLRCSPDFSIAELFYDEDNFNISHLFKIPYDTLVSVFYALSKDVHVSWEAFNEMPWFWILMLIDEHKEFIEKQNKENDTQNDMFAQQQAQMESMTRMQQQNMPKFDSGSLPNLGNMNFDNL